MSGNPSPDHEARDEVERVIDEALREWDGPMTVGEFIADRVLAWMQEEGFVKAEWQWGFAIGTYVTVAVTEEYARSKLADKRVDRTLVRRRGPGPWEVVPDVNTK